MSGWLIALIAAAAVFIAGAICCKTIGGKQRDAAKNAADVKK
jgi:hypothetical protein